VQRKGVSAKKGKVQREGKCRKGKVQREEGEGLFPCREGLFPCKERVSAERE
jgi:hypothetical protein